MKVFYFSTMVLAYGEDTHVLRLMVGEGLLPKDNHYILSPTANCGKCESNSATPIPKPTQKGHPKVSFALALLILIGAINSI